MVRVKKDERGVLYKNGDYVKLLQPGLYFNNNIERYSIGSIFAPEQDLLVMLEDPELAKELLIFDLADNEFAVYTVDGNFRHLFNRPGKHAVWKNLQVQEIIKVNINETIIEDEKLLMWCKKGYFGSSVSSQIVELDYKGILYIDRTFQKVLEPGTYYFWKNGKSVVVKTADMRQVQLEIAGQELMTKDKITLRINFVALYQITDIERALNRSNDYIRQVYIAIQLALRDYVGTYSLEELLEKKDDMSSYVVQSAQKSLEEIGVNIVSAGVKDIILPGDIRDMMNQVILAEKQAQANIITRREETASTRNMLNTAKLMDENKTLMRLREMEHLERIAANIGNIEMSSKGEFVEQLKIIAGIKKD